MRHCLNLKNPHKNMGVPSSVTVPTKDAIRSSGDAVEQSSILPQQQEGQITCQFCKYLLEGTLLGDCHVIRWIGSGTFGDVYEAQQLPPLNRRVAIRTELSSPTPASISGGCGATPAPRMGAAMVWDGNQVLLYGGMDAANNYFGDLWSFDPSAKAWTALQCSGNSPGARSSNAVWDGQHMLLLGGVSANGLLKDFWSYTPGGSGGNGWQQLAGAPMGPRAYQTLIWDNTDGRLYVFGGLDANGLQQDDFWMYNSGKGWVQVTPLSAGIGTGRPAGRQEAIGTWDSKNNVMLLMGGWETGQGVPYYGVWTYDPLQDAWGLVTPDYPGSGSYPGPRIIPGRTAAAMVWDTTHQRAYIYAGSSSYLKRANLNDLWMLF